MSLSVTLSEKAGMKHLWAAPSADQRTTFSRFLSPFSKFSAALTIICTGFNVFLEPRRSSGEIFKGRIYRELKGRFSCESWPELITSDWDLDSSTLNLFSFISRLRAPAAHFIFRR